jgi:hypothetical protein
MSHTERALRLVWRICVVMPIGLAFLILELLFGMIAVIIYLLFLDFTGAAMIRVRLYRNARWEVIGFFLSLRRIAVGEEP